MAIILITWYSLIEAIKLTKEDDIKISIVFRSPPSTPISFAFDESLVEDTSGKLQPNQLTVDNLTVEWLKEKLTELEATLLDNR